MKKLNKRTEFDKQWEDAFKDAEMAPSEGVWDKVDSALSKEEAGYFRKRAFLYKLLAAASIVFALGVGMFSINYYLDHQGEQVAQMENSDRKIIGMLNDESSTLETDAKNSGKGYVEKQNFIEEERFSEEMKLVQNGNEEIFSAPTVVDASVILSEDENDYLAENFTYNNDFRAHSSLEKIERQGIILTGREEMILEIDHIYLIPIMPKGSSKKKKESEAGVFLAGLDFSTGIFNPNFKQGGSVFASSGYSALADTHVESVNNQLASFNVSNKDFLLVRSAGKKTEPDISFGYGANLGFKLTRRIIVQTGIGYRKLNTTTTTTGYFAENGSNTRIPIVAAYQYQLDGLSSVNKISETNLSNQYEFASIPLRAGYIFLDKKINLTLMAGITSEIFLNNQIKDKSNYLQTLSSSSGDGSPYKNVYFNGSLGTMLGYTFSDNYMITLEPSYRFALSSFTRDDFYLNSYPSSFMLSFGVAYNFK